MAGHINVGIDVDGVLRDFSGKVNDIIFREWGLTVNVDESWNELWKIPSPEGISAGKYVFGEWAEEIFTTADVIPGALEAYKDFCLHPDFTVYIVSNQKKEHGIYTDTWLKEHGFDLHVYNIYTKQKALTPIGVLIDDHIKNIEDMYNMRKKGYLVTLPHNRHDKRFERVSDLRDAYNKLSEMYRK